MQQQLSTRHRPDPATDRHPTGPDLRVVTTPRSGRVFRSLGIMTAALVIVGGYVHWCLYRHGYRTIPKIGTGFLLQVLASAAVASVLLAGAGRIARLTHVTDHLARTVTGLAAVALAAGTLVAFALTRRPGGLFNFQERGLQPSPQALIALVAEVGVLLVAGASLVTDWTMQRTTHKAGPLDL